MGTNCNSAGSSKRADEGGKTAGAILLAHSGVILTEKAPKFV